MDDDVDDERVGMWMDDTGYHQILLDTAHSSPVAPIILLCADYRRASGFSGCLRF